MGRRLEKYGIRLKIFFLFLLLVILPYLALITVTYRMFLDYTGKNWGKSMEDTMISIGNQVSIMLDAYENSTMNVYYSGCVGTLENETADRESIEAALNTCCYVNSGVKSAYLVVNSGEVYCSGAQFGNFVDMMKPFEQEIYDKKGKCLWYTTIELYGRGYSRNYVLARALNGEEKANLGILYYIVSEQMITNAFARLQMDDCLKFSEAALVFAESCEKIEFSRNGVLDALKEERLVDIRNQYGVRTDNMLYQLRSDGKQSWLFLAHCNPMKNPDLPREERLVIEIKGTYQPILYDAMTGAIRESSYIHKGGSTFISETVYDHDSLLYALVPTEQKQTTAKIRALKRKYEPVLLLDEAEVTLEEPNVLILDMAEARLDDGPWERREEILRLDNRFRERVGYPKRGEAFVQPWIMTEEERVEHRVTLRYVIHSEILVTAPILALEHAREARVTVNGEEVFRKKEWESSPCHRSYFVDHSIETVRLPDLQAGENILMVELPYYHKLNLESMYLLGDFGVRTAGKWAVLISPVRKLAFGDICGQGFPFYGGNLTYRIPLNMEKGGNLRIEATQFRCPLIKVTLDKKDCGRIAFSPYTAEIEGVAAGSHLLELTAFGNRHNTFGALHNCNQTVAWKGHPDSYRTVGSEWAYEYQLHPQGILKSPRVSIWNDINT